MNANRPIPMATARARRPARAMVPAEPERGLDVSQPPKPLDGGSNSSDGHCRRVAASARRKLNPAAVA